MHFIFYIILISVTVGVVYNVWEIYKINKWIKLEGKKRRLVGKII